MSIDQIDKQILIALFKDGRISLNSLSKTILKSNHDTMSHAGIAKRISKLDELGHLSVNWSMYMISRIS